MTDGRQRYGDPRTPGTPGHSRRPAWIALSPGRVVAASFCLLVVVGLVVGAIVGGRRGDSEFETPVGVILIAAMCAFFLTIAAVIVSDRLESRAWFAWELTVVALLLVTGMALLFWTDDFINARSTGLRTPTTPAGGRVMGAILLVLGALHGMSLVSRRRR